MALTAEFGYYYGNPKLVNKAMKEFSAPYDIKAYDEIDDLTCSFVLGGSGFHRYNYMRVTWPNGPDGSDGMVKYYFIERREGMPANMTKITATCDVLYTYASRINGAAAVLNRTSNTKYVNFLLKDNHMTTVSKTVLSSKRSEKITDNEEYFYVGVIQNKASLREV